MNKLRLISLTLAKVPSLAYALAYLLLIPAFAFTFWSIPYDFYHSTVQYEDVLNEDAESILSDIRTSIVEQFEQSHGEQTASQGKWSLDISTIAVHSLKPEADRTHFTIRVELWGLNEMEGVQANVAFNVSIENEISFASQQSNGEFIVLKQPEVAHSENLPIAPSLIFPYRLQKPSWPATERNNTVLFPMNKALHEKILAFSQTVKGFPAKASGGYARMFYFSAVTITTLGYGDIVPITTTARILVALESILGIVLIGLFLNSLSREGENA